MTHEHERFKGPPPPQYQAHTTEYSAKLKSEQDSTDIEAATALKHQSLSRNDHFEVTVRLTEPQWHLVYEYWQVLTPSDLTRLSTNTLVFRGSEIPFKARCSHLTSRNRICETGTCYLQQWCNLDQKIYSDRASDHEQTLQDYCRAMHKWSGHAFKRTCFTINSDDTPFRIICIEEQEADHMCRELEKEIQQLIPMIWDGSWDGSWDDVPGNLSDDEDGIQNAKYEFTATTVGPELPPDDRFWKFRVTRRISSRRSGRFVAEGRACGDAIEAYKSLISVLIKKLQIKKKAQNGTKREGQGVMSDDSGVDALTINCPGAWR